MLLLLPKTYKGISIRAPTAPNVYQVPEYIWMFSSTFFRSFFTRKAPVSTTSTSDGDGGNDTKSTNTAKTPTKNKEQKNIM